MDELLVKISHAEALTKLLGDINSMGPMTLENKISVEALNSAITHLITGAKNIVDDLVD